MRSIREEHHHCEIVPKEELSDTGEDEQHTAKPDIDSSCGDGKTARALPAHSKLSVMCQRILHYVDRSYLLKDIASGITLTENPSTPTGVALPRRERNPLLFSFLIGVRKRRSYTSVSEMTPSPGGLRNFSSHPRYTSRNCILSWT